MGWCFFQGAGSWILRKLQDEGFFAWATRFRRLVKGYERFASTLADLHIVAFVYPILKEAALFAAGP